MPSIFWLPQQRRTAALHAHEGFSTGVADEIVQAETIDRLTLWPTRRIRACLRLNASALTSKSR